MPDEKFKNKECKMKINDRIYLVMAEFTGGEHEGQRYIEGAWTTSKKADRHYKRLLKKTEKYCDWDAEEHNGRIILDIRDCGLNG